MDDIIVRSRYPRYNLPNRRRRKSIKGTGNLLETIARQMAISVIILLVVGIVKSVDTPVTNYISDKIKGILVQNIDIKNVYENVNGFINKLTNKNPENPEVDYTGEEAVPASASMDSPVDADDSSGNTSSDNQPQTLEESQTQQSKDNVQDQPENLSQAQSQTQPVQDDGKQQSQADKQLQTNGKSGTTSKTGATTARGEVQESSKGQNQDSTNDIINFIKKKYTFITPVNGAQSSPFGWRTDPYTNNEKYHYGIDIEANKGVPIKAALGGQVIQAATDPSYGNYIRIQHGDGIITAYAHCSVLSVKTGQKVKQGDVIGKVGDTGAAIGPHLHFEVWKDGKALNPLNFIKLSVKN